MKLFADNPVCPAIVSEYVKMLPCVNSVKRQLSVKLNCIKTSHRTRTVDQTANYFCEKQSNSVFLIQIPN